MQLKMQSNTMNNKTHISHQHYGQYFKKVPINELKEIVKYKKNEIEVLEKEIADRLEYEKELSFKYMPYPLQNETFKMINKRCSICKEKHKALSSQDINDKDLLVCHNCIKKGIKGNEFNTLDIVGEQIEIFKNIDCENIEQIENHTPSVHTYQQLEWRVHCDDLCEFIDFATDNDILNLTNKEFIELEKNTGIKKEEYIEMYSEPIGMKTDLLMFRCRKCGIKLFHEDLD